MVAVLESFLVNIGFKVDEKGAHDAQGVFDNLSKSALQFGAIVAGKLALDKAIGDFNRLGNEVSNFQAVTGVSAQSIDQMGYAFGRVNGTAADAMATVKNLQSLMASPLTGNTGWMSEAARFGVDPTQILNAKDAQEAFLGLADQFQNLTLTQQVNAAKALGLDESGLRLLQKGRGEVTKYYEEAKRFGTLQSGDTKIANDYAAAMQDVDRVFGDIRNTVGRELTPAVTELAHEFAEWYADNREFIQGNLAEALKLVAENLKPIVAAMTILGGASALKTLTLLLRVPGAIVAAGGAAKVAQAATAVAGGGAAATAGTAATTAATAAGVSTAAVVTGTAAALLYSGTLNDGEDEKVDKIRARRGDSASLDTAAAVTQYLVDKGWTVEQATGIAANLQQESQFNPNAVGDGGRAYGIAQWHGDRQAEFYKKYGKQIQNANLQEQLDFLHYEMTEGKEKRAGDALRGATNARAAAEIVSRQYERPADRDGEAARRGASAERMLTNFQTPTGLSDYVGDNARSGIAGRPAAQTAGSSNVTNNTDNKTVNINISGDVEQFRQVVREEVGTMTSKTMADMQSSER